MYGRGIVKLKGADVQAWGVKCTLVHAQTSEALFNENIPIQVRRS